PIRAHKNIGIHSVPPCSSSIFLEKWSLPIWSDRPYMVRSSPPISDPRALKRNLSTPPTLLSPCVLLVHRAARASRAGQCLIDFVQGRFASDSLCRISAICHSP